MGVDDEANRPNVNMPDVLNTGLTLIGKQARVPAGAIIGRNCVIHPYTPEDKFPESPISSGSSI